MLSFRNSSVLSRLAGRGGTMRMLGLLGLLASILAACGPGGGRAGY